MPGMPRIPGKPTDIAYKILGKPDNIAFKRSKKEKKINRRLIFEETTRVRQGTMKKAVIKKMVLKKPKMVIKKKKEMIIAKPKKSAGIVVAKGVTVKPGVEQKMREHQGSSNAGKYKNVAPKDFAGKSGGASKFSFPIDTLSRAKNALARAHFAPNPSGIKTAVYRKYPELKKRAMARDKND